MTWPVMAAIAAMAYKKKQDEEESARKKPSRYDIMMQEEERRRAQPSGYVQNPYTRPRQDAVSIQSNPSSPNLAWRDFIAGVEKERGAEFARELEAGMLQHYGQSGVPAGSGDYQPTGQDMQAKLQQEEAERLRRLAQQAGISRGGY